MRRYKPPYDEQYKLKLIELARSGRTLASLVREFGLTDTTLRSWIKQADLDQGVRKDGLPTVEKDELARLRRENARLREERDILKKAAAWFAQEEEASRTHKKRSDS